MLSLNLLRREEKPEFNCSFVAVSVVCVCWWKRKSNEGFCPLHPPRPTHSWKPRRHPGYLRGHWSLLHVQSGASTLYKCKYVHAYRNDLPICWFVGLLFAYELRVLWLLSWFTAFWRDSMAWASHPSQSCCMSSSSCCIMLGARMWFCFVWEHPEESVCFFFF